MGGVTVLQEVLGETAVLCEGETAVLCEGETAVRVNNIK